METLDLSGSGVRSDSRLKSLFWPSIQSGADVDYLGSQGYWVCTLLAMVSFLLLAVRGELISACVILAFFYIGGVGVRERSVYASIILLLYVVDTLLTRVDVVRVLFGALLLSNFRATWIASSWKPESEEAVLPPRMSETLGDKFADQLPRWLWPKIRIPYYVFSAGFLLLMFVGLAVGVRSEK